MNPSLLLRLLCLAGVLISGIMYFQIRNQKISIETNLNQSRMALQERLEDSASLKSRVVIAEETSEQMTQLAEEEQYKAVGFKNQFDRLSQRAVEAENARQHSEDKLSELSASNRDLQRQVNTLTASVPPQSWRVQQNQLQSRLLELEAENTSLKRSLASTGQTPASVPGSATPLSNLQSTGSQALEEVIRIGPDGSFAIISYGRKRGASAGQTLAFYRDQQQVALVSLTQITNDFSIAQILSSTNTGNNLSVPDIQIGDTAHLQ